MRERSVFVADRLFLLPPELGELLSQSRVLQRQDLDGQDRGVLGAGLAHAHGGDRDARRHLDGAEQRVHTAQAGLADQGHADDRYAGPRRQGAGQMGGHARRGDDYLDAFGLGCRGEVRGDFRRAMGRDDPDGRFDAEVTKLGHAALHDLQITIGTHYHGHGGHFLRYHLCSAPREIEYGWFVCRPDHSDFDLRMQESRGIGMTIRKPIVAGQFYPADRDEARAAIGACLEAPASEAALPESIVAGLVPHAGWTFSGPLAAMVFAAIQRRNEQVKTFVVCGAAHGYLGQEPALDDSEAWETPLGRIEVDQTLREALLKREVVTTEPSAHRREHSIEVQLPFIQHLFPAARVVPIIVPARETAVPLGDALGELALEADDPIVCIGSTDLTHYGPRYGFTPVGAGADGLRWAHEVNDVAFLDCALGVDPEGLLAQALENGSACGPGAAATVIAAARCRGVDTGRLLAHTNSNDIMRQQMGASSRDSVGYAAVVF